MFQWDFVSYNKKIKIGHFGCNLFIYLESPNDDLRRCLVFQNKSGPQNDAKTNDPLQKSL